MSGSAGLSGASHWNWNGGRHLYVNGYVGVRATGHPKATGRGSYVYEHVIVAERALGKHLPNGAQVHHLNGRKNDNAGSNLVVCQDYAYHALLHQRQRALDACGNANWRRCAYCKHYSPASEMRKHQGNALCHSACKRTSLKRRVA